ncbi:hypothetical protein BCV71DRAFT_266068 [Rhizopus microsporus]|uniref:Uncharacterized protein n=1 Tax=Rhizopus microsporus TaxID=58291 RepID=A0A1X0RVB6_RHIZD|nr:hypothetical protein BCV71DRAFT_266068 [Rhizopus microsporus]
MEETASALASMTLKRSQPLEDNEVVYCFIKVLLAVAKVYKKRSSISHSEVVYNPNTGFPCFKAIVVLMKDCLSYFSREELAIMTT